MGPASTAERQQNSHLGPEKPESLELDIPGLVRMVLDEIGNTIRTTGTGHAAPQAHQTPFWPAEEKCSSSRTSSTDLLWLIVGVSVRCLEMDRAVGVF